MKVIIGAGAAGLLAAVAAVQENKSVVIYEKMDKAGIKLGLAGGGRCNISNTGDILGGLLSTRFLRPALSTLDNSGLRELLKSIGVDTKSDQQGRVYPKDLNGRELALHIVHYLKSKGVAIHFNSALTGIHGQEQLEAIEVNGNRVNCQQAILACGGNTCPKTGSDGLAWRILRELGHTVVEPLPALAPVKTREDWPTQLKGLSLKDITVTILADNKKVDQTQGDLLFTHFGLSGPAVLDVSHAAAKALSQGKQVHIVLDFIPKIDVAKIVKELQQQRQKTLSNALMSLLPTQLAKQLGSDQYIKGLAPSTLEKLARELKETRLEIVDVLGKNHAMVSQGGISLKEVNPRTMESKVLPGLYIAGEMLDYHGRTGGFNLHGAFATGYLAGKNF